jgi:hypothetical protein
MMADNFGILCMALGLATLVTVAIIWAQASD